MLMLTTFPNPPESGFESDEQRGLSAPATLRLAPLALQHSIIRIAMYKHIRVTKTYNAVEYPWCSTECFSTHVPVRVFPAPPP